MKKYIYLLLIIFISCSNNNEIIINETSLTTLYFPPINENSWETLTAEELNWNTSEIETLNTFLEENNTKGFIILYNGRIVLEKYFNEHSNSKVWYWASAGKTLTSITTGIAEENGYLNINNSVSSYLGEGWTNTTFEKENLITCKHLLTMTSGLDDELGDSVDSENLQYIANAGERWAYHNVYKKLQNIISTTTNVEFETYFETEVNEKIGMTGFWYKTGEYNLYYSNTRSMARFGLLAMNNGTWGTTAIVNKTYFKNSINTSQSINKSYGYLWWLNGKKSYMLPQSQLEFSGEIIPNAPSDMYAALGKNDQKIYVIPSKKLVIVRMGESADNENFAVSTFDNDLWEILNSIIN
ncbi:serine hydrolase [Lutibacter sp. TH_r2]|uniref:serine hydrolase domain-containing protein n=1 Tax=Lutibacter sp. TH_r2 TaxID=3082083 RepID=UPI002955B307|nr:serine hydrolase [Lutibacter sp. TH_r2]MDV7187360.1 serine hydrolase [Lutibacter sp. TH_r2]